MEDIRPYRVNEDDDDWHIPDDEKAFYTAAGEDDVPFHIPRD
jgi:hypothetical protein